MIELSISGVVALVGLFMFALAGQPKLVRIGEIMFGCGLLAGLLFGVHYFFK
jgi:hypothetical protein